MLKPHIPANEQERLSALYEIGILDTMPEEDFDHITMIASELCQAPMSLVSIIDKERQWFKSAVGVNVTETPRELSFCAHAILNPDELFVVPDSRKDERFHDNPYVTGEPHVAFYAGVPLVTESGHALGTLCVLDKKPKELSDHQKRSLRALANQAAALLELRRKSALLNKREQMLMDTNAALERFAYVAAHDLRSPCNRIQALAELLQQYLNGDLSPEAAELIQYISEVSINMRQMIDGILNHARIAHDLHQQREKFTVPELAEVVERLIERSETVTVRFDLSPMTIFSIKSIWIQVLINLINNGIRYNDKQTGWVRIQIAENDTEYIVKVLDNGMGIDEGAQERIFELFETGGSDVAKSASTGTGIGLHTVKRLVRQLDGTISVQSTIGEGATFTVSFKK